MPTLLVSNIHTFKMLTFIAAKLNWFTVIPEAMVIPGSSGLLQMVDYILIDVPLANVYLDFPTTKDIAK